MPAILTSAYYQQIHKTLFKFILCLILTTGIITYTTAQQAKPTYNLLWRISGKGLKQSSYLFGTMHVKNKQVFNFSDSVMLAIQKTSAFAMEVHPDTMIQKMFNGLAKKDSSRDLHKLLSKDEYDQLAQRFKERNGYEMGDIDPMFIESNMTKTKAADDKPTFVDAYLYGIARSLSKKICGLENAADQFNTIYGTSETMKDRLLGLLDQDDDEEKEKMDAMIKVYSAGNLEAIKYYLTDDNLNDDDLVARNQVMAKSIIAQMTAQSLFTAIGVAHLPGANGVIELLKKEGYTLTAVPATFTGVADTYHIDYDKMDWQSYNDTNLGYSMEMPGTPVKTTAIKDLETVVYTDLTNEAFFGAYAFVKGTPANPVKPNELINSIIDNFKTNNDQLISRKQTLVNGYACTDVVVKNSSGYMRMNIYVQNNTLYCLYVGNQLEQINQPYATRFFNSFRCFKVAPKPAQVWSDYSNDLAAFKVQLPAKPQIMVKEMTNTIEKGGEPIKMNIVFATDTINLINYIIRYNDYPPGMYLGNRKSYFERIEKEMTGKNKLSPMVTVWKDSIEGREFTSTLLEKYYTTIQIFPRGNRVYILMRQSLTEGTTSQNKDAFFSSFKFLPHIEAPVYTFAPEGQHFKIQMPAAPRIMPDSLKHTSYIQSSVTCYSTNPHSGGLYGFEYSSVTPYYRTASVDSMYSTLIDNLVDYRDSLIKVDTVIISGFKGREYLTQRKDSGEKMRYRLLIENNMIYLLSGYLSIDELFNSSSNKFFNSLTITPGALKFDLLSSKAEKIKEALLSTDTSIYKLGWHALNYYSFDKSELPVVYTALKHHYTDDTTATGARSKLVKVFATVQDEQTLTNLQQLYADADGKDEVKAAALSAMPRADKQKGYDTYLNLLTTGKPIKSVGLWKMFNPLSDSLAYSATNFSKILPLINSDEYRYYILALALDLVNDDKHAAYSAIVTNNIKTLMSHAGPDLDVFLHGDSTAKDDMIASLYRYLNLMRKIKGQTLTDNFTAKLISPKSELIKNAVITRIHNRLPVNQIVINKLLDSLATRHEIMSAYNEVKQLAKVPLKYTRPDEFARVCMYNYLNDDEDEGYPEMLKLLGSITDKGHVYYAFKFTLEVKEEGTTFIGIAGPFKTGASALNFKNYQCYTDWEAQKHNWQLQARKMIPKLVEQNKESAKYQ